MMKKLIASVIVGFLCIGGAAYAEEDIEQDYVSPESELYETSRLMEDTEYEYTEDFAEKALIQDEYADKRLAESEEMLESDNEEAVERSLEDYNEHLEEIDKNLEQAKAVGEDITQVESIVAEKSAKRSENLASLLDREDLPEEAKAGVSKALENQEKAMQKMTQALEKAAQAREQAEARADEAKSKQADAQPEERNTQTERQPEETTAPADKQPAERAVQPERQPEERTAPTEGQPEERTTQVDAQPEESTVKQETGSNNSQNPNRP